MVFLFACCHHFIHTPAAVLFSYFSMRFVRETHSIEVVMLGSQGTKSKKHHRLRFWRKTTLFPSRLIGSQQRKQSDDCLSDSPTTFTKGMLRARSESECEYSPQKRNAFQLLQKRGVHHEANKRRNNHKKPR